MFHHDDYIASRATPYKFDNRLVNVLVFQRFVFGLLLKWHNNCLFLRKSFSYNLSYYGLFADVTAWGLLPYSINAMLLKWFKTPFRCKTYRSPSLGMSYRCASRRSKSFWLGLLIWNVWWLISIAYISILHCMSCIVRLPNEPQYWGGKQKNRANPNSGMIAPWLTLTNLSDGVLYTNFPTDASTWLFLITYVLLSMFFGDAKFKFPICLWNSQDSSSIPHDDQQICMEMTCL